MPADIWPSFAVGTAPADVSVTRRSGAVSRAVRDGPGRSGTVRGGDSARWTEAQRATRPARPASPATARSSGEGRGGGGGQSQV